MGDFEEYKPTIFMFVLQFVYAGVSLSIRAALLKGMSPRVFVVYRQAIATIVIAPIAFFVRRKENSASLGCKSFWLIFSAALIGIAINQNIFFEGIFLATSSMASTMANLVPAVTFMASLIGLEKVNLHSLGSLTKIMGTTLCVGGAVTMALLRGPKLLNSENIILPIAKFIFGGRGVDNWVIGCLFLFGSACCWSFWLILQIPVTKNHPDYLSLTAWLCFMGTLQSAVVALVFDRELEAWTLNSNVEVFACLYTGFASAIAFFGQAWCIARRGPLFSAMFNPLCTVIVTILASIFLHEEIYIGSLAGGIAVVIGLYIVLWGKAKELKECHMGADEKINSSNNQKAAVKILIADNNSLEKPLLAGNSTQAEGIERDI